jgi:hypothetical protein
MTDPERVLEEALTRYHEGYHSVWRPGGDAADHDEAHREGVCAVLELERDRPRRLEEAVEAANELFSWIRENYPAAMVASPNDVWVRVRRAGAALSVGEEGGRENG